jgi:dethiobiotin synthetase
MAVELPPRVFVTGTDTGIGKTLVSSLLVIGLGADYWKPVQCGLEEMSDRELVIQKTGIPESQAHPEAYRLRHPLSPHAAASLEGITIEIESIRLPSSRALVIEGAGGIMVPLNDRHFMLDLMKRFALPVLLVASSRLGTINHTLLSLEQLRRHDLEIAGVVINGPKNSVNREAIYKYGNAPILAEVEPLERIDPETLGELFRRTFWKGR